MKKLLIQVFVISLVIWGCGKEDTPQQPGSGGWGQGGFGGFGARGATSVETQDVTLKPIAEQVRSYGTIKAQDVIAITPQTNNRITDFYADLGDTVRTGQLLAKINDKTFRDQLSQAEAQVEQARIAVMRDSADFYRQQQLSEKDLTSDAELQIAEVNYLSSLATLESAKASLTQAQENFGFTEVRAPVHGVIISRTGEEGDLATTGTPIFEIANLVGYETRVFLPVQDWRFVKIGQKVRLRVSNEAGVSAEGTISRKSPQLDATTGLGEVVITLTNTGPSIYPGVLTESVIDIVNKPSAVVIPRSALVEKVETVVEPESNTISLDKSYSVFVSVGDTVAQLRPLELGIEQGDKIEVVGGLRPGEKIIVTGQSSLQDGAKIRVASGANFSSPSGTNIAGQPGAPQASGERPTRPGAAAFANMSDEERQKMRQRMQTMSPEERTAFMDSLRSANSGNE